MGILDDQCLVLSRAAGNLPGRVEDVRSRLGLHDVIGGNNALEVVSHADLVKVVQDVLSVVA